MKKTVVFALLTLIGYTACKKETVSTTNTTAHHSTAREYPGDTVARNSNNPYDSAGIMHNQYLDTITIALGSSDTSLDDVVSLCHTYSTAHYQPWNDNTYDSTRSLLNNFNIGLFKLQGNSYLVGKISNLSISYAAKNYLATLFFTTLNPSNYTTANTYADLKANIVSLEATILADNSLSSSEKQLLLGTCSVARYSSYYWGSNNTTTTAFRWIDPRELADDYGWALGDFMGCDCTTCDIMASVCSDKMAG